MELRLLSQIKVQHRYYILIQAKHKYNLSLNIFIQMIKDLEINAVIGFSGNTYDGLLLHPDNEHIVYPLGSTVVVRHILSRTQTFLRGHASTISSIKISRDGKFIATAERSFPGQTAQVIVWDFSTRQIRHRLKLHKTAVTSLAFSPDSQMLASQGCLQDKNMLVVWDIESGKSLYGTPNKEVVNQILFFNNDSFKLIAVTQNGIQILTIDQVYKKIQSLNANFGNVKRHFTCAAIDNNDGYVYCGSKTGDVFQVNIDKAIYKRVGPVKKLFSLGITCIKILPNGDLIVGSGQGKIGRISIQTMGLACQNEVMGVVTSISFTGDYTHFFCGTSQSNIYWINATNLNPELRNTCHYERINDIAFPSNYSDVFATASLNQIRIWNCKNRQELLRIQVPGLDCYSVFFMHDGKSIISGWSDGKIRAFLPQSGKLLYVINDAHNHGCTSVTATSDGQRIISGGAEGEIRVWRITKQTQTMETSMKEHRSRVWSIEINRDNSQAISASGDGSCIIWDLKSHTRILCLFESTAFKQAALNPEEYQILTAGSDRKITYWEKHDGQIIRSLECSNKQLNTLAITSEGKHFVTGGQDGILKIWNYDEGISYFEGQGHSGSINKVKISPDQRTIISVGSEGAIFFWRMPQSIVADKVQPQLPTMTKNSKVQNDKSVKGSVKSSVKGSVKSSVHK